MATSIKRGDPQSEKIKYIKGTFFVVRPDEKSEKEAFWIAYALEDVPAKNTEVYVRWLTVSESDETEYKISPESASSKIPIDSIIVTTVLRADSKQESVYRISKKELKRVNIIVEEEEEESESESSEEEKESKKEGAEEQESESESSESEKEKKPTKKELAAIKKLEKEKAKKQKEKEKEKAKKQKEKEKEKAKKQKEKEISSKKKKSSKKEAEESSSSESESESETEKKSSSKKKPTKKSSKKKKQESSSSSESSSESESESSSNESESEDEKKPSKKSLAKTEKQVIKPLVVKKSSGKRKKDEEDEEEEGSDAGSDSESTKATKKSKVGKVGESKKVKKEPKPKVVKPTKASLKAQKKKGNPNPEIPILETDPLLEFAKTSNTPSDFCCSICTAREATRAVLANNMDLLKAIIKENRYNSLISNWSSAVEKSPFDYAILTNNIEAIQLIYKDSQDTTKSRPTLPRFEKASTGSYSKYTYGHNVRALTQSRGGKEGDEAFLHDSNNYESYGLNFESNKMEFLELMFTNSCVKLSTILELFKLDTTLNDCISDRVYLAVRAGNLEVSEYFIKDLTKRGGFGFNILHQESLCSTGEEFSAPFKSVSVTKKPNYGNVTPIHFAAINPKGKYLKSLLDILPDVSRPDHNAFKPLHYAAACTSPVNVNLLVTKGVELSDLNSLGQTPLMIAAQLGRVQNIKALAKAAKDRQIENFVKTKNKKLQDALHFAAEAGQLGSIRALLEEGADIDIFEKGTKYTALMKAAMMGHFDAVRILVEEGKADVEKKDKFKRTALVLAAINGHIRIVSFLLHFNAQLKVIDSSKNSILHFTSAYGWTDITKYLVDKFDCPINEFNDWKTTPLSVAIRKGHFQTTKFLLDKNADANVTDEDSKSILLQSLGGSSLSLSLMENLKYLIIQGKANVGHVDKDGNGVLHVLCLASIELPDDEAKKKQNPYSYWGRNQQKVEDPAVIEKRLQDQLKIFQEIANFLIEKGTPLNVKNKDGITPIMLAFQEKNIAAIIYFLSSTKEISLIGTYSNTKSNILHDIMKLQDSPHFSKVTDLLLTKSKDLSTIINQYNKEHMTPLMSIIKNFKSTTGNSEYEANFSKFLRSLISTTKPDLTLVEEKLDASATEGDAMDTSVDKHNSDDESNSDHDDDDDVSSYDGSDEDSSDEEELDTKSDSKEVVLKRTVLHFAVLSGSSNIIKILLEFKPKNIDPINIYNETPLHIAIENNHFAIASLIIDSGANLKISNSFDRTPLHLACAKMNFPLIKKLTIKNSPINKQDYKGLTPLMIACQNKGNISDEALEGEDNPISILLQNGADPKVVDSKKRNALHYSINASGADTNSSFEIEDLLIKHSAPLNEVDYLQRTPLHYAFIKIGSRFIENGTSYDPVQVVSSLCSFSTIEIDKPDKFGRSPLFYACQHGSTVSALLLIQRKAEINRIDEDGNSPLAISLLFKHPDCAISLIQKGANVKTTLTKFNYKITKTETPWNQPATNGANTTTVDTSTTVTPTATTTTNGIKRPIMAKRFGQPQEEVKPVIPQNKQPMRVEYKVEKENIVKVGLFYHVVSNNWQGVAYIMLDSGLDNFSALHDAFKADKYQLALTLLSKCRSAAELSPLSPESKQNLFHFIGMYPSSVANWSARVQQKLLSSGVSPNLTDTTGKTPLHYAAISENAPFTQFLIQQKLNINQQDKDGNTPFTLALQKIKAPALSLTEEQKKNLTLPYEYSLLLSHQPNLELKFKYSGEGSTDSDNMITPLIYAVIIRHIPLINSLLNAKANVNTVDALGQPPIFYAVKSNKMDIVNLLLTKKPNLNIQDSDKKSVIHCVVNPTEYGSFENVKLLQLLVLKGAKIDLLDIAGKPPMYYASLQDSGKMKNELITLGAKKIPQEAIPQREVSTISNWSNNTIDYEKDYAKFIESKKELLASTTPKTLKPIVDPASKMTENSEVYVDSTTGLIYDILMTKVDVKHGNYGENNFYKMQVIYNPGLDRYFLFNRWGRIGDLGQFQKTPYSKDEALSEFTKIFKAKSGNAFTSASIANFQKMDGKYHLVHIDRNDKSKKEILHPFVLSQYPKSQLPKDYYEVMAQFCNVEAISKQLKSLRIDTDVMPLGRISKDLINKAIAVLGKLGEAIELLRQIDEQEKKDKLGAKANDDHANDDTTNSTESGKETHHTKLPSRNEVLESQIELSNEFYELIPHSNFTTDRMVILKNEKEIKSKINLLNSLDEMETVAKILIAAHQNTTMHPYDYCAKAIGASIEKLDDKSPEFGIIKKYAENTGCQERKIVNIFKLQRKGEAERFQAHKNLKNHFLLWHGSLTTNYLSILSQGLKIAPPESPVTGYMFGKGIYWASAFRKSINYCGSSYFGGSSSGINTNNFLLLAEVALGTMKEFKEAHYMESPFPGTNSTKGVGRSGPNFDDSIILNNGVTIPLSPPENVQDATGYTLEMDEYIVYDASQVRMRYLVEVSN